MNNIIVFLKRRLPYFNFHSEAMHVSCYKSTDFLLLLNRSKIIHIVLVTHMSDGTVCVVLVENFFLYHLLIKEDLTTRESDPSLTLRNTFYWLQNVVFFANFYFANTASSHLIQLKLCCFWRKFIAVKLSFLACFMIFFSRSVVVSKIQGFFKCISWK